MKYLIAGGGKGEGRGGGKYFFTGKIGAALAKITWRARFVAIGVNQARGFVTGPNFPNLFVQIIKILRLLFARKYPSILYIFSTGLEIYR